MVKSKTKPKYNQTLRLFIINNNEGTPLLCADTGEPFYFNDKMLAKAHKPDVTHTVGFGPDHHRSN